MQCKLWNSNHRPDHVELDLQQSLKDLQLTYIDNFVIHWPMAVPSSGKFCSTRLTGAATGPWKKNPMFPIDDDGYFCADTDSHYVETWQTMEKLVERGLCKSIGLSNFTKKQIGEVHAIAKVPISTLQNECHPYLQQKDLIDYCGFLGIAFQAFSPLGSGDTHLATTTSPTGTIPLKDAHIAALAAKYGKNSGQIMLKWGKCVQIYLVAHTHAHRNQIANVCARGRWWRGTPVSWIDVCVCVCVLCLYIICRELLEKGDAHHQCFQYVSRATEKGGAHHQCLHHMPRAMEKGGAHHQCLPMR